MEELASRHDDVLRDDPSEEKRDVRTKFKLSSEALDAKEWLADYWDMSQKDVAEVVAEVTADFLSGDTELRETFIESAENQPGDRSRKTHVVSAATRDFLRRTSRELDLTRDQFFDGALRLVRSLVQKRQEQQIENHKELLPEIRKLREHAEQVSAKVSDRVHDDDPLWRVITDVQYHLEAIERELDDEIGRGEPLESDHDFI